MKALVGILTRRGRGEGPSRGQTDVEAFSEYCKIVPVGSSSALAAPHLQHHLPAVRADAEQRAQQRRLAPARSWARAPPEIIFQLSEESEYNDQ